MLLMCLQVVNKRFFSLSQWQLLSRRMAKQKKRRK